MKIERGSFTIAGTGNQTVLFNDGTLTADEISFSIAAPSGSSSVGQTCDGFMTPTQQCARSIFCDGIGERSEQVNNKCMLHYANVSSTITKVIECTRVDMATPGEFTINVGTHGANYQVYFIAKEY